MIWTFILGGMAGWGARLAEDHLRGPVQKALASDVPTDEMRVISLAVCLFAASILALFIGSSAAVPLVLGALIGVLGPRMYDRFRAMRAPDYDS